MKITLKKATLADLTLLQTLSEKVWRSHYPSIISMSQIDYMLQKMYGTERLTAELQHADFNYLLAYADEEAIGYLCISNLGNKKYMLNKFYLLVEQQGKGLGERIFNLAFDALDYDEIQLYVNRLNFKSVNFYFKLGFKIVRVLDNHFGAGYYMNDFFMVKKNKKIQCGVVIAIQVYEKILPFLLVLMVLSAAAQSQQSIPAINQQIVAYVKTTIGRKVDRGECWDLANRALTEVHAVWKFPTQFGKEVHPEKDSIYPGDIIQFTNVKLKTAKGESWTFPKHTAIVYEVLAPGEYRIAEQNVNGKRKVQIDDLNYKDKVAGKLTFYRPQAQ